MRGHFSTTASGKLTFYLSCSAHPTSPSPSQPMEAVLPAQPPAMPTLLGICPGAAPPSICFPRLKNNAALEQEGPTRVPNFPFQSSAEQGPHTLPAIPMGTACSAHSGWVSYTACSYSARGPASAPQAPSLLQHPLGFPHPDRGPPTSPVWRGARFGSCRPPPSSP